MGGGDEGEGVEWRMDGQLQLQARQQTGASAARASSRSRNSKVPPLEFNLLHRPFEVRWPGLPRPMACERGDKFPFTPRIWNNPPTPSLSIVQPANLDPGGRDVQAESLSNRLYLGRLQEKYKNTREVVRLWCCEAGETARISRGGELHRPPARRLPTRTIHAGAGPQPRTPAPSSMRMQPRDDNAPRHAAASHIGPPRSNPPLTVSSPGPKPLE